MSTGRECRWFEATITEQETARKKGGELVMMATKQEETKPEKIKTTSTTKVSTNITEQETPRKKGGELVMEA